MADRITIDIDAREIITALDRLLTATGPGGLEPALREIGEDLVESTKRRFDTSTGPDGRRWAPNAQATFLAYLGRDTRFVTKDGQVGVKEGSASRNFRKDGRLSARGVARAMNKKPLVDSGLLQDTITYLVEGDSLFVGTNRFAGEWDGGAAVHQFGNSKGTIPARPFLGVDEADAVAIMDAIERHLADQV